jgi:predicted transcriptional regulator of viral defense system
LGKVVHLEKVRKLMKSTPVFRAIDVELLVGDRGYSSLLLHNLAARGEVFRVTKGWYSASDDPIVSVFAFRPAYLGLEAALSIHDMWEQETNVVIVSASKVRPGLREVMGSNVVVHRISHRYLFGFDYLKHGGLYVPVSDPEKTLIDLVYFGGTVGGDTIRKVAGRVERRKLAEYLRVYPAAFRERVEEVVRGPRGTSQA